ncbi:putative Acyl-CoA N-acyltransferase [Vibrio nigripulchritudo MADA3029]|uniref:Acyl-CoA N-acyltransferase n=1 Tax=Vibrio nigripulchritudo SOn1 TaxID=1238450 RepID=A0AAV2VKF9_9VIBR|nr:GNAT family N-acetyltransferase [Vibrio nigripulchritudo]KJY80942.1 biphenyl 2,3-dioxygenase [Vibrio nigripulchritudo]CCN50459.1 putative Acyl-CoA N-acyltransferase [Vibrio nigripulchritudo MADA3020]CCN52410.1 putative Acyl-CoA N-acyltransferase [Vibrio nigripulchritudo MADA3021]CCN62237.1 putative Acyl-CoA N-acyltransferase [Vibrio nigripulchritudo MADA3029]CCO44860.1 putative Acyl-CoA N-acyltransferase [Vibrio nigripulchritudo SOn1]
MDIQIYTSPEQSDIDEIKAGLRKHNTPFLKDVRHEDFLCYLNDDNGKKIAGLIGEIWGNWLQVNFLWVDESQKSQGLGKQLLKRAEDFAKKNGCHSCLLDTFSFQAKPFYEKQGYQVQMQLEDFPENAQRFYMVKTLK